MVGVLIICALLILAVIVWKYGTNSSSISVGGGTSYQKSNNSEVFTTDDFVRIKTQVSGKSYIVEISNNGIVINGKKIKE